jgi:hypothetical protein
MAWMEFFFVFAMTKKNKSKNPKSLFARKKVCVASGPPLMDKKMDEFVYLVLRLTYKAKSPHHHDDHLICFF